MKVVLLCGGFGTRISEETVSRPKPMVTIGNQPILWHIMNHYAHFGFKDFSLALGYKAEDIKDFFLNYYTLNSDFSIDLANGHLTFLKKPKIDWHVDLVDTGLNSMTGGRLKRLESLLRPHGTFMLTYGDGLSNVNLRKLLEFHRTHGKLATVTSVRPTARFGTMSFNERGFVTSFREKQQMDEGWINGGFFIFEPGVFDYIDGDQTVLEASPLEGLARDGQLVGYQHTSFWQCMDTIRDRQYLEELWKVGNAPWTIFD